MIDTGCTIRGGVEIGWRVERKVSMARRRWQAGCIFKRSKNWILRYREDVLNPDGSIRRKHRSLVLGPLQTKSEAHRAAEAYLQPLNGNSRRPVAAISLTDFWQNHFARDILPTLKKNTRLLYTNLFSNHVQPMFGKVPICELTQPEIQHLITLKQQAGYSTQTLAHIRNLSGKVLGTALSWGWVRENAARGVKLPPMQRRRQARVLTPEEIAKLAHALREPARTVVLLGVLTGLRIGELLGLRVEDVDFDTSTLHVRRSVCRGEIGTPKTPGSEREIPLPRQVTDLLKTYLAIRPTVSEWLFPTSIGTFQNDRTLFLRQVQPVTRELGPPHFSWHSLRHTFSTHSGNNGVPIPVLQSILGHASAKTTMVYTHPLQDAQRQAVEKLAGVLFPLVPIFDGTGTKRETLIQ
jgi:integrase